ncbi:hypothetical protein [Salinarimonas soli]|uniref:Uncharacterized protein n=1 Tax=Salinarimonas soli TaxID=1638099 RepID=A0A5B2VG36_9HYPH|nr:hypothetical protein [Salinarimonas soli]KAA2237332.1 hypothetical protein F0L46_10050 [Salinarimonas soli]
MRLAASLSLLLALGGPALAQQQQAFRIEEARSAAAVAPAALKPGVVVVSDGRGSEIADPVTGLVRFEDWERTQPRQKRLLSLYPSYVEPTINVTVHGVTKPYKEKLHVYVAEARFLIDKPAESLDLARFATTGFLERIDPAIRHRPLNAADIVPLKDPEEKHGLNPQRPWCGPGTTCLASTYQLEGKLPMGIRLANKLEDSGKKISEAMEFQSELRVVPAAETGALAELTALGTPVAGAVEQSIFWVNQVMQFGKFLAVFQRHPADPAKSVCTVFMALGVETDVLEKKKEFERVPVLRNLVPAQVLSGNSSFNTGASLSAGLPSYTRNQIKAVAAVVNGR